MKPQILSSDDGRKTSSATTDVFYARNHISTDKKLKIVIPILDLVERGGVKMLLRLADFLVEEGNEVTILSFMNYKSNRGVNFNCQANIKLLALPKYVQKMGGGVIKNIIKCIILIFKIGRIDIVIANYFLTAYVAYCLPNVKRKMYYCQAYEPIFFDYYGEVIPSRLYTFISRCRNAVNRILALMSYKLGLEMIANNETIVSYIKKQLKDESTNVPVLNAFYNPSVYRSAKRKARILTVGTIASSVYWKGTHLLIDAIRTIQRDKTMNVQFTFAFGDKYKNSGLLHTQFVNPCTQAELAEFYRSSDILVSPMLIYNEFPLPPIEAMACGSAVISTPLLYAEHMKQYYKISLEEKNALKNALVELIRNDELRESIRDNGNQFVKQFSEQYARPKFLDIINRR